MEGTENVEQVDIFTIENKDALQAWRDAAVSVCMQYAPSSSERSLLEGRIQSVDYLLDGFDAVFDNRAKVLQLEQEIENDRAAKQKLAREREDQERDDYGWDYVPEYERPKGMLVGIFSKWLGPLPTPAPQVVATPTVLKEAPSYHLVAVATLVSFLVFIAWISNTVPWMLISPFDLVGLIFSHTPSGETSGSMIKSLIYATVVLALTLFILVYKRKKFFAFINKMACDEEQWFRMGAENWPLRQRVISCLSFGACHIYNLIYPMVTLLGLSMVGAVLMVIYLREYKKTSDVRLATLASTRLHATYNRYTLVIILGAFLILPFI